MSIKVNITASSIANTHQLKQKNLYKSEWIDGERANDSVKYFLYNCSI